jgi:hypothetical protein
VIVVSVERSRGSSIAEIGGLRECAALPVWLDSKIRDLRERRAPPVMIVNVEPVS